MEEKIIRAFCGALGIDASEFIATLKGEKDELEYTDTMLGEITAAAKNQVVAAKNETEKRFTRVAFEKYRKAMKEQGFTVPEGVTDVNQLITEFAEFKSAASAPGELTKEAALKNPIVKELLADKLKAAADAADQIKNEFEQYKKVQGIQVVKTVGAKYVEDLLTEKRAILETENVKKEARLSAILNTLPWENIRLDDKNKLVLFDPETNDLKKDTFGKVVPVDNIIIDAASIFGFHKQDPTKSGSGGGRNPETPGKGGAYNFQDRAAFDKAYSQSTDPAERAKMSESYFAANPEG